MSHRISKRDIESLFRILPGTSINEDLNWFPVPTEVSFEGRTLQKKLGDETAQQPGCMYFDL